MITVIANLNLLFVRYVVYDQNNQLHERIFLQWPWTRLSSKIGPYQTLEQL